MQKKRIDTIYLNVNNILVNPKIKNIGKLYEEFKLSFPNIEDVKQQAQERQVNFQFELPIFVPRSMLEFILNMNDFPIQQIVDELNQGRDEKDQIEWFYRLSEVGGHYYYEVQLHHPQRKLQYIYSVKQEIHKYIDAAWYHKLLQMESSLKLQELMNELQPKNIVITSSESIDEVYHIFDKKGIDEAKIKVSKLKYSDTDRGLSIMNDLVSKEIKEQYVVLDNQITPTYVAFGDHLLTLPQMLEVPPERLKAGKGKIYRYES